MMVIRSLKPGRPLIKYVFVLLASRKFVRPLLGKTLKTVPNVSMVPALDLLILLLVRKGFSVLKPN
jgi:hypothetical protein